MSAEVFTRKDYLSSNGSREEQAVAHRRFYAQLVDEHTIRQVVSYIGADRILRSTDPHFNDVPLSLWDHLAPMLRLARRFQDLDDYATLAGLVCVAKEAARQYAESHAPVDEKRSHEGEGSGIWQCYACLGRVEALTEGADTKCPFCGSYELHLADGPVAP